MKKFNVSVSPAANDRLSEHFEFLANVNENAARKLLSILVKDIRALEKTPHINPYFDRPYLEKGKYRYKLSNRRYRIIYQISGNFIFVDDIQDCRQDDDKNILNNYSS